MTDFQQTNAPVVRTETKTVGRRIKLDETDRSHNGSTTLLTFTKDISIFVETESRVVASINGAEIKRYEGYNDHYGFVTSFKQPLEHTKQFISMYGEHVLVEVVTTPSEFGGILFDKESPDIGRMFLYQDSVPYLHIPKDWLDVSTPELRARADAWLAADGIEATIKANAPFMNHLERALDPVTVFSSALSPDANIAAFETTLRRARDWTGVALTEEQIAKRMDGYRNLVTAQKEAA